MLALKKICLEQYSRDHIRWQGVALWDLSIHHESEQVWALILFLHGPFMPSVGAGAETEQDPSA